MGGSSCMQLDLMNVQHLQLCSSMLKKMNDYNRARKEFTLDFIVKTGLGFLQLLVEHLLCNNCNLFLHWPCHLSVIKNVINSWHSHGTWQNMTFDRNTQVYQSYFQME